MKILKCDLCEHKEKGETFEKWMDALKPHYFTAHADVMRDSSKTEADMNKWMLENRARFEATPNNSA